MKPNTNTWLNEKAMDIYSQFGEDGIIESILSIIGNCDKWCVEFGAWDGMYLSNTYRLISEMDYHAVLIEADKEKYNILCERFYKNPKVISINKYVNFSHQNIDLILSGTPIPKDFDFISIDIDGCDYHIWDSIKEYSPKVVCIEYNPTITTGVYFVQPKDFDQVQGSSISSLVRLANSKGYELVATTRTNCFFVKNQYFSLFDISENSPETLRTDNLWVSHIFSDYHGKLYITGGNICPWNGIRIDRQIRQLPRSLQGFPSSMNFIRRKCLGLWKRIFNLNA